LKAKVKAAPGNPNPPPSLDIFVESGGSGKDVTGCALKRMGFTQPQRRAATIAGLDDTTSKA